MSSRFKLLSLAISALVLSGCWSDSKKSEERSEERSNKEVFESPAPEEVQASVKSLDLTRTPTTEELIAAGQLGGNLTPTHAIDAAKATSNDREMLQGFGEAIEKWNQHDYRTAYFEFKDYADKYPNSPWAGEAKLHMGCEARFNGRYNEASDHFESIIKEYEQSQNPSAQWLVDKAKMRLGVTRALENNFDAATSIFSELATEGYDWRIRTYSSHWIRRLSQMKHNKIAMLNCGSLALASILESRGQTDAAAKVRELLPKSEQGFSIDELRKMANEHGLDVTATDIKTGDLNNIRLPAVLHIERDQSESGHYWILEQVVGDEVILHDTQIGRRFRQTKAELANEWSGTAVVFESADNVPGRHLTTEEAVDKFGGCCGVPRPEKGPGGSGPGGAGDGPDGGDDGGGDGDCDDSKGAPVWSVNPVSMNLHVKDTPLWYSPAYGPEVKVKVSYNSQSAIQNYEPFGNKWTFNYGSYLVVDPGNRATVFMPDGARIVFQHAVLAGYTAPPGTAYRLSERGGIGQKRYILTFGNGTTYTYARPQGTESIQTFLTEITDKYGHKLKIHRDNQVRVSRIEDAQGRITRLRYNAQNLVQSVTGPFGRTASFKYDDQKNLISLTDMGGFETTMAYDEDVYVTEIRNPKGAYRFKVEAADGDERAGMVHYNEPDAEYMWENYRITVTDPNGNKEEYFYDGYASNSWHISANNYVEWESESKNNYTHGKKTLFEYARKGSQNAGAVTKITHPDGRVEDHAYNSKGLGTSFQHSGTGKTLIERNETGYITKMTLPNGNEYAYERYLNTPLITRETTPFGETAYQFNDKRDLIKTTEIGSGGQNATTELEYNDKGQLTKVVYPSGAVEEYVYNSEYQLIAEKLQGQTQNTYTYDAFGRLATETNHKGETYTYEYNGINSITKVTYPDGQVSEWQYGQCPRLVNKKLGRGGRSIEYQHDAKKRLNQITRQDGSSLQFKRDKNGNITTLVDEMGKETQWEYDVANKKTKKVYADNSEVQYNYDKQQRFESVTDARGVSASLVYDELGRIKEVVYSDDTPKVSYRYNDKGLVDQIQDAIGTHTFTYDRFGNVKTIDGPWKNDTQTFHYNLLGRLERFELEGSEVQSFEYDVLGRLTKIKQGKRTFEYQYQGQESDYSKLIYPNGVTEERTQGSMGKLDEVTYKSGSNKLAGTKFEYNNRDLISKEDITPAAPLTPTIQSQQIAESSNNLNQLTKRVTKDLNGATKQAQEYQYDKAGNQTKGYTKDGHAFTATYDALSQVKTIEWEQNGKHHQKTFRYFYNRFLAEIKYEVDGKIKNTTRFVRLGFLPLQERDQANTITRHFTWGKHMGGGIGGLLSLKENSQNYFYLYDGKGNVSAILDDNRNVKAAYDYSPYGELIAQAGDLKQPYHAFSTKRLDAETGMMYFGYRFYLPKEGRWLNRDPLGEMGGVNLYAYVDGNPVNYIDAHGLHKQDKWYGENDPDFRDWVHDEKQGSGKGGADNFTKREIRKFKKEWNSLGKPRGKGGKSGKGGQRRSGGKKLGKFAKFCKGTALGLLLEYITPTPKMECDDDDDRSICEYM